MGYSTQLLQRFLYFNDLLLNQSVCLYFKRVLFFNTFFSFFLVKYRIRETVQIFAVYPNIGWAVCFFSEVHLM